MTNRPTSKTLFVSLMLVLISSLMVGSVTGRAFEPAAGSKVFAQYGDSGNTGARSTATDNDGILASTPQPPPSSSPSDYVDRNFTGTYDSANSITNTTVITSCSTTQGFDVLETSGWEIVNRSNPVGTLEWFQGNSSVFPSQSGDPTSYVAANYNSTAGVGTISDWLISPPITFQNGDVVSFFTRTQTGSVYPDRLQLRMSLAGVGYSIPSDPYAVGEFTLLLTDINPTYTVGGYPEVWKQFSVVIGGLNGPREGRLAFRYFIENGGPSGTMSNYIGVDSFSVCRNSLKSSTTCKYIEGYDTVVPQDWIATNLSNPLGTTNWFQGESAVFPAQSGALTSYAAANYNNTAAVGTISNWLLTPEIVFSENDQIKFYTRTTPGSYWPDRLEVRLSTNLNSEFPGTDANSVGDFTTLLLAINPTLVVGGYPTEWTEYTITLTGLGNFKPGRLAFRYYVTNGGPSGANSNYIGIDTFSVCRYGVFLPSILR